MNETEREEYGEGGEITFHGMWKFLKKSALRLLIYVVAAAIAVTAVFLGVRYFGGKGNYAAVRIEYTFPEITVGKSPDGTAFDKDEIRSTYCVSEALAESGLLDKVLESEHEVRNVRSAIAVSALVAEKEKESIDDEDVEIFPTQFVVTFGEYKQFGFSDEDARNLVSALVTVYRNRFIRDYFEPRVISDGVFEITDDDVYDYIDYCRNIAQSYETMSDYVSEMLGKASSFSSTAGNSFTSVNGELSLLRSMESRIRSQILQVGAFKDLEAAKTKSQNRIGELTAEKDSLQSMVTETQEQLKNFKLPSVTTTAPNGTTTTATVSVEAYEQLQLKLTACIERLARTQSELTSEQNLYDRMTDIESTASNEETAAVKQSLSVLCKQSKTLVKQLNELSEEYMGAQAGELSVRTSFPAATYRDTASFPTAFAYLAGIVAAIVVALIVTRVKSKKAMAKKQGAVKESAEEKSEK